MNFLNINFPNYYKAKSIPTAMLYNSLYYKELDDRSFSGIGHGYCFFALKISEISGKIGYFLEI